MLDIMHLSVYNVAVSSDPDMSLSRNYKITEGELKRACRIR